MRAAKTAPKKATKASDKTYIFIDTETTDLIKSSGVPLAKQPRIIEFCGIITDDRGKTVDELNFLCDPGFPVPDFITRITGIKTVDVAGKPGFDAYASKVKALIERSHCVIAHNLQFDMGMVNYEFARIASKEAEVNWPVRQICTVEQTSFLKGYPLKMGDMYEHLFGERFPNAHRARNDVVALVKCFWELKGKGMI